MSGAVRDSRDHDPHDQRGVDRTVFVVPCFDEAGRIRPDQFARLAEQPQVGLVLVDDGSNDSTLSVLEGLAADRPNVVVVALPTNRGKAEAVRAGMLRAIDDGATFVGFCDADLATPVDELIRLDRLIRDEPSLAVLLASRVALLGHEVDRSITRHYLGRLFATASSIVLRTRVYDTQCGAKLFRSTPMLRSALSEPFHSRWSFDVELLGRLLGGGRGQPPVDASAILEVPLKVWTDVRGSKLGPMSSLRSAAELLVIERSLRAWRGDVS